MNGSFRIAKFFGIPVELHWTFGLLFAYIIYANIIRGADWTEVMLNLLFVLALFVCVVMHEFGHALTARRYGVQTKDIILSPIGGIARLDKLPERPYHEFLVAIAGPAVNVAIVLLLSPFFFLHSFSEVIAWFGDGSFLNDTKKFIPALIFLNIVLAGFNLLPAFPMDGGRILRSLLSMRMGRLRATRVASLIGQVFAVLFVIYGIWIEQSIFTAFIGVFVFFTANQEYQAVKTEDLLQRHLVAELVRPAYTSLSTQNEMFFAANLLRQGLEKNFLVFDPESRLRGTLNQEAIIYAIKNNDLQSPLEHYTIADPPILQPSDTVKTAYEKLYYDKHNILPVMENGELVGVVDVEAMNHFLAMERKIRKK